MKILILLLVQVIFVFCQVYAIEQGEDVEVKAAAAKPDVCLEGFKPICPANEVWGCGYGDACCTPCFVCGTGPCHTRCFCKSGYKRNAAGACVRFCPMKVSSVLASLLKLIG